MTCGKCGEEGNFSGHNKICNSCRSKRNNEIIDPADRRRYWLKCKYGITPEQWDDMFEEQAGLCAICFTPEEVCPKGRLAVDHCHHTGKVRGLLCLTCNSAIGKLKDDPELVLQAYKYLERHN